MRCEAELRFATELSGVPGGRRPGSTPGALGGGAAPRSRGPRGNDPSREKHHGKPPSKRRQVYLEGRLSRGNTKARDGSGKRYATEIVARQIRFLANRNSAHQTEASDAAPFDSMRESRESGSPRQKYEALQTSVITEDVIGRPMKRNRSCSPIKHRGSTAPLHAPKRLRALRAVSLRLFPSTIAPVPR